MADPHFAHEALALQILAVARVEPEGQAAVTIARMLDDQAERLLEENARLRYRMTDAALADHCPHCEGWANHPDAPCWWCGRITEAAAQARADAQKAATA